MAFRIRPNFDFQLHWKECKFGIGIAIKPYIKRVEPINQVLIEIPYTVLNFGFAFLFIACEFGFTIDWSKFKVLDEKPVAAPSDVERIANANRKIGATGVWLKRLNENDFKDLVTGKILKDEFVQVWLADIGYFRMGEIITEAWKDSDFKKNFGKND